MQGKEKQPKRNRQNIKYLPRKVFTLQCRKCFATSQSRWTHKLYFHSRTVFLACNSGLLGIAYYSQSLNCDAFVHWSSSPPTIYWFKIFHHIKCGCNRIVANSIRSPAHHMYQTNHASILRCLEKAPNIIKDHSHPDYSLSSTLLTGKRYKHLESTYDQMQDQLLPCCHQTHEQTSHMRRIDPQSFNLPQVLAH